MSDGTLHHDGAVHGEGVGRTLAAASLRAVDGGMRVLQRLRARLAGPDDEAESRDGGRSARRNAVEERPAAIPRSPTLLHRALVVFLCLLIGGAAGTLLSYRGLARLLDSRQTIIEFMQDEIAQSRKEEALSLEAKSKYQIELGEYRKRLRESQYEAEEYKSKVEELNNQLLVMKRAESPASQAGRAGAARSSSQLPPQKSGTCVTGTAGLGSRLADCIDKFNRP